MYETKPETFEAMVGPFPASVRETAGWLRRLILESFPGIEEDVEGAVARRDESDDQVLRDRQAIADPADPIRGYRRVPSSCGRRRTSRSQRERSCSAGSTRRNSPTGGSARDVAAISWPTIRASV